MVKSSKPPKARLAVDIGGTFTDVVLDTGGALHSVKVPTTPEAPEQGFMEGLRLVLRQASLAPERLGTIIHGTTLATNALIERKGAKTALITTEGFRDSLEIGYEARFDQYDLMLEKPEPLVPRKLRLTVPERMSAEWRGADRLGRGRPAGFGPQAPGGRRRGGRGRLPAQLRQSGPRGAGGCPAGRGATRSRPNPVKRGLSGDPRVRAALDRLCQCLCPAA